MSEKSTNDITHGELYRVMQQEHAIVMRMLGHIEGTLESVTGRQAEMKGAHEEMNAKLSELTAEVRGYRNYFFGFMAAVSLLTSAAWWAINHVWIK